LLASGSCETVVEANWRDELFAPRTSKTQQWQ